MDWPGLESTRGSAPKYWDLNWVIRWADCFQQVGLSVYNYAPDDICTGYIYGHLLLHAINFLRIDLENSDAIGLANVVILSALFGYISYKFSSRFQLNKAFLLITFTSPGIWLLLASGNFDSVMFVLIAAGVYAVKKEQITLAALLFFIGSLIKFYSFPLILLLLFFVKKRVDLIWLFSLIIFSLVLILNDLAKTTSGSPGPNNYFFTFGVQNFGTWLELLIFKLTGNYSEIAPTYIYGIGIVLFIVTTVMMRQFIYRWDTEFSTSNSQIAPNETMRVHFLFFGGTYLALFFQGTNYDYKLIFYIMAFLSLITSVNLNETRFHFCFVFILSLWLSCFSFGFKSSFQPEISISTTFTVMQFIGDILNLVVTCFIFLGFLFVFFEKIKDLPRRFWRLQNF
jgi:hypothetical protein